jgi:hypothetical protein
MTDHTLTKKRSLGKLRVVRPYLESPARRGAGLFTSIASSRSSAHQQVHP